MFSRPFKAPSFLHTDPDTKRPTKKQRRSSNDERVPLAAASNPPTATNSPASFPEQYFTVLWRRYTTKKNKTWDGDGVLAVAGGQATLTDSETAKVLGKIACTQLITPGSLLAIGGKEIEVENAIRKDDFLSGRTFLGKSTVPLKTKPSGAPSTGIAPRGLCFPSLKSKSGFKATIDGDYDDNAPPQWELSQDKKRFRTPMLSSTVVPKTQSSLPQARHDMSQPNALIMKRPAIVPRGKQIVDVVVDPLLVRHLRDHQREGVKFLYECVMGMRCEGEGAILADEMGLGKTLQTIALLWTLMKQNPVYESPPVVTKALIVCPAGLVENWRREFRKWLGNERVGIFVANGKNKNITNFTKGKAYNVMIIGYEMLRSVQEEMKKGQIDIVIADEGHRLKTANNKAMQAIQALSTERRIILSGTPLQNDLSEFYTAIDFVNPGLLGQRSVFKRTFEVPIMRSRQPDASESDLEKGEARWKELVSLTSQFMIRRTSEVLSKYLPPKTEHIVFCKPTPAQATAYQSILASPIFAVALGNSDMALQLINVLKKVCNSPALLKSKKDTEDTPSEVLTTVLSLLPSNVLTSNASSTKLRVLDSLIHRLHTTTDEKIVIVSNYTATLDMIEKLLTSLSYTFLRLDGSTPVSKRQAIVEKFNKGNRTSAFAFLLSAKSGGVGLNLIGASRLVLFDVDWNPATDLQAMARIHRDGQKLPCKVYRFLVKGGLDEKIFQRQVMKMGLANAVVDNKASASSFSRDELRDLFRLDARETCQTHDLLGCPCDCQGASHLSTKPVNAVDSADEEDDDLHLGLKTAIEVDIDEQEARIEARRVAKQPKLTILMEYQHLDPKKLQKRADVNNEDEEGHLGDLATHIDDDVFLEVLKEPGSNVEFIMTKTTS